MLKTPKYRSSGLHTSSVDGLAYGSQTHAALTPISAGLTKTRLAPFARGQMNCCTGLITDSGVMCSTAMEAPCIIDDGASCPTVAGPVTTPVVGVAAFIATVGASSVVQYGCSIYTALSPAYSDVPGCYGSANMWYAQHTHPLNCKPTQLLSDRICALHQHRFYA